MSLRLGMILSKDCPECVLEYFREKYGIKLMKVYNPKFLNQLMPDEILIEPTGQYDDSDTGIGCYEYYTKDLSGLDLLKQRNKVQYDFIVKEIAETREHYLQDAIRWFEIIKEMKEKNHIGKVGIFYFGGYTTTDMMDFPMYKRNTYAIQDLSVEYLMQIHEDEIVFFI